MDRRTFVVGSGLAGITALAGCTGGPDGGGSGGGDGENGDDGGNDGGDGETDASVAMVYAEGGLDDKSFNDAAQRGLLDAADEYNIEYNEAEPNQGEFGQFQRQFADGGSYDLISCIGFVQEDPLTEVSADYPDQNFMLIDAVVEADNVANYLFEEHEGSFLVGYLAGLLTVEDFGVGEGEDERATNTEAATVGFVGGEDEPLIQKFQAGFEAGVEYAAEEVGQEIDVDAAYVGSFRDASAGRDVALSMYDNGADIIYHASGATGTGVFQAAQDAGHFAIGVDSDQSLSDENFADVILASMVKRVETAVYESITNVIDDEFEGGSTVTLGLEDDGVACVYGDEIGDSIPGEIKSKVDEAREAIIADEVDVPDQL
ncbi:BMP family lipoprotein [Haloferacaceae archaeon DSL9]